MKSAVSILLFPVLLIIFTVNTSFVDPAKKEFTFTGYFGIDKLVQDKKYWCAAKGDSISLSMCRFYVSNMKLLKDDVEWGRMEYKLIDLFDSTTTRMDIPHYSRNGVNAVRFYLGIDSVRNVAGVGSGDLDPTKGMYWSWQSGYINMKLEGNSKLCSKSKNEFQYHLGGYASPNNALQLVELKLEKGESYNIKVDVEQFFSRTDMRETAHVMSPALKAVELSVNASKMFSIAE